MTNDVSPTRDDDLRRRGVNLARSKERTAGVFSTVAHLHAVDDDGTVCVAGSITYTDANTLKRRAVFSVTNS